MADDGPASATLRLLIQVDLARDHVRGTPGADSIVVVGYQDFLCPYCRRLQPVVRRLRKTLGERLVSVYRQFPNERANPGAELAARASEAAGLQGKFFEMHDGIFDHDLPVGRPELVALARKIGLDMDRFTLDLEGSAAREHVERDAAEGRDNGVTGTPTLFVDGVRYDGAWDYHAMLESLERPLAARVHRSARVFASLPTSAGLVLLVTAVLAIACANSPVAGLYERVMDGELGVGPVGRMIALSTREWLSEGLLSLFFLVVGLEIRREMTVGALTSWRAALLPVVAAMGGVVAPALIYLALNRGPTAAGWPIPTATDVAFCLALLAVLGDRVPAALRVFVAALAVVDDLLSVLTLAIFFPRSFAPSYGWAVLGCVLLLVALNRARVYATWPYVAGCLALWAALHATGVDAALSGVVLAMCVPTRPAPSPAPLVAQAATALSALDHAEKEARRAGRNATKLESEPVWEWAARNLSAAADRLQSPAERLERAVAPWSTYVVLPLFAFSATGVSLAVRFSPDGWHVFAGSFGGLVVGKPLGIVVASWAAMATGLAVAPRGVTARQFIGAACLCGIGDMLAFVMADRAFTPDEASVAKLGVLLGSVASGLVGAMVLRGATPAARRATG